MGKLTFFSNGYQCMFHIFLPVGRIEKDLFCIIDIKRQTGLLKMSLKKITQHYIPETVLEIPEYKNLNIIIFSPSLSQSPLPYPCLLFCFPLRQGPM